MERFNRTLASIISIFVDDNHSNWDEPIPYVTMAYRANEHKTTGLSPNMLMPGRETSSPLDIMYEMPPSITPVPISRWVWELRERLETAHMFVRQNIGESMKRQKTYRDGRLSYGIFEHGDNVYVYFPVKKVGHSSKLTSYWRGPFQVSNKLFDVLYKVNCGRSGSTSVIHCDRMRKAKEQVLAGEVFDGDQTTVENELSSDDEGRVQDDEYQQGIVSDHKRIRRNPVWTKDYILSSCRSTELVLKDNFTDHVVNCSVNRLDCDECEATFKRKMYLDKHKKRKHDNKKEYSEKASADCKMRKENLSLPLVVLTMMKRTRIVTLTLVW